MLSENLIPPAIRVVFLGPVSFGSCSLAQSRMDRSTSYLGLWGSKSPAQLLEHHGELDYHKHTLSAQLGPHLAVNRLRVSTIRIPAWSWKDKHPVWSINHDICISPLTWGHKNTELGIHLVGIISIRVSPGKVRAHHKSYTLTHTHSHVLVH